jgi:hypothetical protein
MRWLGSTCTSAGCSLRLIWEGWHAATAGRRAIFVTPRAAQHEPHQYARQQRNNAFHQYLLSGAISSLRQNMIQHAFPPIILAPLRDIESLSTKRWTAMRRPFEISLAT